MDPDLSGPAAPGLWFDGLPDPVRRRPRLDGDAIADVVIVGAGFTGLWTAYALLGRSPSIRVLVVEAATVGYGASGRNGGWASALFAARRQDLARHGGPEAVRAQHRAMVAAIDDIARVCAEERIDCGFHRGGTLTVSRSPAQDGRVRGVVDDHVRWGLGPEHPIELDRDACDRRIRVRGTRFGVHTPDCARIDPARLVVGLAEAVERRGGIIRERTPVIDLLPDGIRTGCGTVRAPITVLATEAWTSTLPGQRRRSIPVYSLMVATEPLSADTWSEIGWDGRETLTDGRNLIVYAQRTPDDRIAFGGRGAPYHFGSRIDPRYDRDPATFRALESTLHDLFPMLRGRPITHRWGGPLGVPRDWHSGVGIARDRSFAWAGGYVGDGVTTANLAGRTLADLILGEDTELTRLPWVGHRSRRWEPEPMRWLAVRSMTALARGADRVEARTGRTARLRSALLRSLTGH
jgi:glycine/D-amino acid oxidase-like deaminating enzyme